MDDFQLSLPGPTECDPEVLQELARPNIVTGRVPDDLPEFCQEIMNALG